MRQGDVAMSLELDRTTASYVVRLARVWKITKPEAVHRALRLTLGLDHLTEREAFVLNRWAQGSSPKEIAGELFEGEHIPIRQVHSLLKKMQKRLIAAGKKGPATGRLEAFNELRRSLHLTSDKAREWQDAIHAARR